MSQSVEQLNAEFVASIDRYLEKGIKVTFSKHPSGATILSLDYPDGEVKAWAQYPDGRIKELETDEL